VQGHNKTGVTPPRSLHNNFGDSYYEEEERLVYPQPHPRVLMLKNTNIESELRGRGTTAEYGGGGGREGRRVHYQERGDYRRHQSPSPGPRDRALHPGQQTD
jgi:hypothetical protein